jgi:broad specificity phosphatase PhoE
MKHKIPAKPFYFIRHGESTWNVLDKFAGGQIDCPLTNKGMEQAHAAKIVFEQLSIKPERIAHSSMKRASDTAHVINKELQLPVTAYDDLREMDGGQWTGGHFPDLNKKWEDGQKPKDGESLNMFASRIHSVFSLILDDPRLPLIAAHGRIINAIEHGFGIKGRVLQTGNCEILFFKPHEYTKRSYPWDVYTQSIKNGQIVSELAAWSQI